MGSEECLRALQAADVKNVRQLRQAVAAPYVNGDEENAAPQSHRHHYLGGTCVLNVALAAGGHPPLRSETLESLMAETGGEAMESSSDAAAAGMALLTAVLAEHRKSAKENEKEEEEEEEEEAMKKDIGHAFTAAGVKSASQLRRMALFGKLSATVRDLTVAECELAGEVAGVETTHHRHHRLRRHYSHQRHHHQQHHRGHHQQPIRRGCGAAAASEEEINKFDVSSSIIRGASTSASSSPPPSPSHSPSPSVPVPVVPCPVLFTAPHGVFLRRDGEGVHKPEEWTTLLATRMADATPGGVSMTWCEAERTRSRLLRRANPANRDPNCVTREEALTHPWGRLLSLHAAGARAVAVATGVADGDRDGDEDEDEDEDVSPLDVISEARRDGRENGSEDDGECRRGDRASGSETGTTTTTGKEELDDRRRRRWLRQRCRQRGIGTLHVDIHGRRDPAVSAHDIGFSDCDLGLAALIASERRRLASEHHRVDNVEDENGEDDQQETIGNALRRALGRRLRTFFASWRQPIGGYLPEGERFVVSEDPVLTGMRADSRMTISQQGVELGLTSVQVELSLRLRRSLKEDPAALRGFTRAITGAWMECCGVSSL